MSLVERDLAVLWHPATHFADNDRLPPLPIARAEGVWLETSDGRRILDAISSWWTCLHGHGHPVIREAIATQIERLDHVMLAGFTHEPAVALAEALLAAAPEGYGRVFYADCGSAAVEVALKLSFQWRRQTGEPARKRFAALRNSYHGETLGALAVSGSDAYRELFAPLLPEVVYLPAPAIPRHEHEDLACDAGASEADDAVALLHAHAHELTALVVEPMVQCAGRMAMIGSGYYRRIVETAQQLGIHVIADEIAVAFGRTGRLFASTWSSVVPDLLCLSKGLSGGVLPLSCVLVRAGFEDAFVGDPSRSFLHSHTFTGNPIACAAGRASLDLLQRERLPDLDHRIAALARARREVAQACGDLVLDHRQAGMIAAFTVDATRGPKDGRLSLAIREAALQAGVLLRPLHDTVYWMPPLVIDDAGLQRLVDATTHSIRAVLG
jgi:adenosylmethionine-8-amino-7-oxononanoate aminotransferase